MLLFNYIKKIIAKYKLVIGYPITFILLCIIFFIVAISSFLIRKDDINQKYINEIKLISEVRASQIQNWREFLINYGKSIQTNGSFLADIEMYLQNRNNVKFMHKVKRWLNDFKQMKDFDGDFIVESSSKKILISQDRNTSNLFDVEDNFDSLKKESVFLSSIHKPKFEDRGHLNLFVSLPLNTKQNRAIIVVFIIDPEKLLFNYIKSRSPRSKTTEIVLAQRDSQYVTIFSEYYIAENIRSFTRMPLKSKEVPSDKDGFGEKGIIFGKDYRGIEVISNSIPIKNSSWFLWLKVDVAEIENEINNSKFEILVTLNSTVIILGVLLYLLLKQEKYKIFRATYKAVFKSAALEQEYNQIFENANDIILLIKNDGLILKANKKATDTYGYSEEEMLKLKMDDLRTVSMTELFSERNNELSNKEGFVVENFHSRKDGTVFPVEESLHVYKSEEKIELNIIRNLTERKRQENELIKNRELASIGKMSGFLAHEIKSPLSAIKMSAEELTIRSSINEDVKKRIKAIAQKIEVILHLLDEVNFYSKNEKMNLHPTKIRNKINILIAFFKTFPNTAKIEFLNNVEDVVLNADPYELEMMLKKLIENSIDAIEGDGKIEFCSEKKTNYFNLFLKDSGQGIKNVENIFDPFFSTKLKGTGFGLPIAKKIIKRLNGDIKIVHSQPGETIIKITFPLKESNG